MNFLPDDYESPKANSGYMKLQDGENRIRILTSPILGWLDWKDKKPLRFRMHSKPLSPVDPKQSIKHFWAFVVWDYALSKVSILEITQASIRKKMESLSKDKDWGAPFYYDLKIIKTGANVETEYDVNPASPRELDAKVKEEFAKTPIDLEELFVGGDPYAVLGSRTKGFWELEFNLKGTSQAVTPSSDYLTKEQVAKIEMEIHTWISKADPQWRKRALDALKATEFHLVKGSQYDLIIKRIEEKKQALLQSEDVPF